MHILFRCNVSARSGTGHFMRCLALAQHWRSEGGSASFVMPSCPEPLAADLKTSGLELFPLGQDLASEAEAAEVARLAGRCGAQRIVLDGYAFGAEYQRALKQPGLPLLLIDDYGHAGHYYADWVLNQNLYATEKLYPVREETTRLLLGTRYVLLRNEFARWRDWERVTAPRARRLVATLGGSDPENVTRKVLLALSSLRAEALEAVVVLGAGNPRAAALAREFTPGIPGVRLERSIGNMAEVMAWADLALAAGGTTCWELSFMQLPAILVTLADNQRAVAASLHSAGAAINAGWHSDVGPQDLAELVRGLVHDQPRRGRMSLAARALVDGAGCERASAALRGDRLVLRRVRAGDCRLLFDWANDPAVRSFSYNAAPIVWEEHAQWLKERLADPACFMFVGEEHDGTPVGLVRFQVNGEDAEASVNVASDRRGGGYGTALIGLGCAKLERGTALRTTHAFIKLDNVASVRAFEKAGFIHAGREVVKGFASLHLVRNKGRAGG